MTADQSTLTICRQIVEALHLLPDERAEAVSRSIFGYLWQIALGPHATLPLNHQGAMMVATRAAVAVAEGRPGDVDSTLGVCPFCGSRLDWMMMSTTPGARGTADCGNGTRARRQGRGAPCLWAGSTIERVEDGSAQWVQPISLESYPPVPDAIAARDVRTATGADLDRLGEIVGVYRDGEPDADYRPRINPDP